jgi:hypothetical protein
MRPSRSLLLLYVLVAIIIPIVVYDAATQWFDFVVYHRAGQAFLEGRGPLYGPESGLGWPQYFRYPPLFLVVFVPFALLPLQLAAAIWAVLKFVVLFFLVRALAHRLQFPRTGYWWLVPALMAGPYLVQEFRNGNVQFLIFALVAAALLTLDRRPWRGAFLLALGASLKVWPLFFVPYLVARRRLRAAALTLAMTAVLTLLPAALLGWQRNASLLGQWAAQEWRTGSLEAQVWYPSQSLGGVLQRYLTAMDSSTWHDRNYRDVHFLALDPRIVRGLWAGLVGIGYVGLLWVARARPNSTGWLEHSLAFCALPLLQPFAHRIVLVVLLWPALVAGVLLVRRESLSVLSRCAFYAAVAMLALQPLVPGGQTQRLFQMIGVDFWATCFLTIGFVFSWVREDPLEGAVPGCGSKSRTPALPAIEPAGAP